jgi:Raf kinase inhibitor-like YbhB/YbcL family protein
MKTNLRLALFALGLAAMAACTAPDSGQKGAGGAPSTPSDRGPAAAETLMSFQLASTAFAAGGDIPAVYTCDGNDVSPPLTWSGTPAGTRSLALIVDDPDAPDPAAPKVVWVHWLLYNLPADLQALHLGLITPTLPKGTLEGRNDWKETGWRGPCPPIGRHRYFFRLYALDTVLPDLKLPDRAALDKAMAGHVLARAELMGYYKKR